MLPLHQRRVRGRRRAEAEGLEPPSGSCTATCFRDRLLIRPDGFQFRPTSCGGWNRTNIGTFRASHPAIGPPRTIENALRESNPPFRVGSPAPLPLGQEHVHDRAAAAGIEPASGRVTAACPYQHGHHRIEHSGRLDSNQRSRAPEARGMTRLPHALLSFVVERRLRKSAQPDSNRHIRPGEAARCRLRHGRLVVARIVKERQSTGPDSNRRCRATRAESSPLDHQCRNAARMSQTSRSGTGGTRTLTCPGKNRMCCR